MNRSLPQLVAVFAVMSALTGSLHYYIWARLVRDTALPSPWRLLATAAIVVLGALMPLSFFISRTRPEPFRPLSWVVFVWMGMVMLLFLTLVALDLVRASVAIGHRLLDAPLDGERRRLFQRALGGAAALIGGGLGLASLRNGLLPPSIKKVEVTLPRLPRALDGLRIAHLTDIHIGPTLGREWLDEVVRRTNALAPDLVAITGDLVDGTVPALRDAVSALAGLRAPRGVYFVTGNHEYYSGADAWIAELRRLGVRVLRNERVAIGEGEAVFDLAGVDDLHARAPGHGPDLRRALEGRDPRRACVLLAHQPKAVLEAARHDVCLQLSGHTHGGQIWPWKYAVRLQQPYVEGLVREKDTQLYVSRGTGYWGPPMRLGADAEIAEITLRASAA